MGARLMNAKKKAKRRAHKKDKPAPEPTPSRNSGNDRGHAAPGRQSGNR